MICKILVTSPCLQFAVAGAAEVEVPVVPDYGAPRPVVSLVAVAGVLAAPRADYAPALPRQRVDRGAGVVAGGDEVGRVVHRQHTGHGLDDIDAAVIYVPDNQARVVVDANDVHPRGPQGSRRAAHVVFRADRYRQPYPAHSFILRSAVTMRRRKRKKNHLKSS